MKPWMPIATGIAGLAVGAAGGWFAHGPPRASATAASSSSAAQSDPTKLDNDTAKALILAEYEVTKEFNTSQCQWRAPTQKNETTWTIYPGSKQDVECAQALGEAGLLKQGECFEPNKYGGDCLAGSVIAVKPAWWAKGNGLSFPCGTFEVLAITSVTTEGNKADILFEREFKPNAELLGKLKACKLDTPDMGRATKERWAMKDDAGRWAIKQ